MSCLEGRHNSHYTTPALFDFTMCDSRIELLTEAVHLLCLASFEDELAVTSKGLALWLPQSRVPNKPELTHVLLGRQA